MSKNAATVQKAVFLETLATVKESELGETVFFESGCNLHGHSFDIMFPPSPASHLDIEALSGICGYDMPGPIAHQQSGRASGSRS